MKADEFRVHVDQAVLDDLARRLAMTRWPDEIEGAGWELGTEAGELRALVRHWQEDFDWRARERWLDDRLPSRTVALDGGPLHFAHVRGQGPAPFPLVLLHGWPGSFVEMADLAPLLADPGAHGGHPDDAFDVVVPSLPGHGFSAIPSRLGVGADECADIVRTLMVDVLGHRRFGAQGGDRGAFVAAGLGHRHPDVVAAIHLNFAVGLPGAGDERTPAEQAWLDEQAAWVAEEGGYIAIQGTRPMTLAYGLHDSPVGMLAWIVEKWRAWSDCGGDLSRCFTPEQLLTNATLYWVTGTMRSSMHMYWEHRHHPPVMVRPERVDIPTGVAAFPREVSRPPRSAVARKFDLRRWTDMPAGGHFAALEQPEALAHEIREFFRPFR